MAFNLQPAGRTSIFVTGMLVVLVVTGAVVYGRNTPASRHLQSGGDGGDGGDNNGNVACQGDHNTGKKSGNGGVIAGNRGNGGDGGNAVGGPPGSAVAGRDGEDGTNNNRGSAPCGGVKNSNPLLGGKGGAGNVDLGQWGLGGRRLLTAFPANV